MLDCCDPVCAGELLDPCNHKEGVRDIVAQSRGGRAISSARRGAGLQQSKRRCAISSAGVEQGGRVSFARDCTRARQGARSGGVGPVQLVQDIGERCTTTRGGAGPLQSKGGARKYRFRGGAHDMVCAGLYQRYRAATVHWGARYRLRGPLQSTCSCWPLLLLHQIVLSHGWFSGSWLDLVTFSSSGLRATFPGPIHQKKCFPKKSTKSKNIEN